MSNTLKRRRAPDAHLSHLIREHAIAYTGDKHELDPLMELVGDASLVLIGEASHGTHEYYKTRIDLTKRLIEEKDFNVVAAEADWPAAWSVDRFVKDCSDTTSAAEALGSFQRFPMWLWRNADILAFVEWLNRYNKAVNRYENKVGFYGLDLFSLHRSAAAVIEYLQPIDPEAAKRAQANYEGLFSYGADEQSYGYAASLGLTKRCEEKVLDAVIELQRSETERMQNDGIVSADRYFCAQQNALLVAKAQRYYREMFRGRASTWNMRDAHMVETLTALEQHMRGNGQRMKAVVWAHNSHLGDARATQMSERGEYNIGQLLRERYGSECRVIGFSGYSGTVTAASSWGGDAERMEVRPAMLGSYEDLFHKVDLPAFILPLRRNSAMVTGLKHPRLQRAIGVIYSPQTERESHYYFSSLPDQFDAVIHYQETQAVEPMEKTAWCVAGEDRIEETID